LLVSWSMSYLNLNAWIQCQLESGWYSPKVFMESK
jgi:hypothetical protein